MAAYAVAIAADGYRVAFSLAELNAGIGGVEALVVDTLDRTPLGEGQVHSVWWRRATGARRAGCVC